MRAAIACITSLASRVAWASLVVLCVGVAIAARAEAHPFGMASVNRYLGFELGEPGKLRVAYVLDLGELPSASEVAKIDSDHDDALTPAEQDQWFSSRVEPLLANVRLRVGAQSVSLRALHHALEASQGDNGMLTLRLVAELEATVPRETGPEFWLEVEDRSFEERPGWRELRAEDSDTGTVLQREPPVPSGGSGPEARRARMDRARFLFRLKTPQGAQRGAALQPSPTTRTERWAQRGFAWARTHGLATSFFVAVCALGFWAFGRALGWRVLPPRLRVLLAILWSVSAALTPASRTLALLLHGLVAMGLVGAARVSWKRLFPRLAPVLLWALGLAFFARERGGFWAFGVGLRVMVCVLCVLSVGLSLSSVEFASALRALRFPRVMVELVEATMRGLRVLGEEAQNLKRARVLRARQWSLREALRLYGSLVGVLTARVLRRAERVGIALELRGWTSEALPTEAAASPRALGVFLLTLAAIAGIWSVGTVFVPGLP